MRLVLLTHPEFLGSLSMPRFARMLREGMEERGHQVEEWTATPRFFRLPAPGPLRKWLGYADQYLCFPQELRRLAWREPPDTLFVFADHALGPWVPLVADRPHAIHCHDFLAQRSALGEIPENPTGCSGRQYQGFIRRGYRQGRNFISVSERTREDLARFLTQPAERSEVVYNGFNQAFAPRPPEDARQEIGSMIKLDLRKGYILHVGGNQWYKNRAGVIEIYHSWRQGGGGDLPLLMIGPPASGVLQAAHAASPYKQDIRLLTGIDDANVRTAYAGASVFLFPSLAEGFGWPIAEAMASGCPVITTADAPMTEVAGDAAFLIPVRPGELMAVGGWASESAKVLQSVLDFSEAGRAEVVARGIANASRFDPEATLDQYEAIYQEILARR